MKLRDWQNTCIDLAYEKYVSGGKHFLTLATPGAGKTIKASALANRLLRDGLIDLVFCFSPSSVVSKDFSETLQCVILERFDGLLGSKGQSLTYQSMQYLGNDFWNLFKKYRVFVIFDEIHHCSGSNVTNANSWGEQIILNIQDQAAYTLALTGTQTQHLSFYLNIWTNAGTLSAITPTGFLRLLLITFAEYLKSSLLIMTTYR